MAVFTCEHRYVTCFLCVGITYADGYPTTVNDIVFFIVQRLEGIAENSSITCGLSDCYEECLPFEYRSCKNP